MSNEKQKIRADIFVDTNVIIGAFLQKKTDILALQYLYSMQQANLYTSTLAVAQTIATLQIKNNNERKLKLIKYIKNIFTKFTIITCTQTDIWNALKYEQPDLEDNIQYAMGKRMRCTHYITNNKKDFTFANATIIPANKIRLLGA